MTACMDLILFRILNWYSQAPNTKLFRRGRVSPCFLQLSVTPKRNTIEIGRMLRHAAVICRIRLAVGKLLCYRAWLEECESSSRMWNQPSHVLLLPAVRRSPNRVLPMPHLLPSQPVRLHIFIVIDSHKLLSVTLKLRTYPLGSF